MQTCSCQGRIQDSENGGHNFVTCTGEHGNCVQRLQSAWHAKHAKSKPSEIEFEPEGIFKGLLSLLLHDSTLHNNCD